MGPKTSELVKVLEDLVLLLEQDGESHWRNWIMEARNRILSSDYAGIEHLLKAYGGMGSFNDLVLGQNTVNGIFQWKAHHIELNCQLDRLRTNAWQLANSIKHNHEIAEQ